LPLALAGGLPANKSEKALAESIKIWLKPFSFEKSYPLAKARGNSKETY
jgi:hypothetical protein